MRVVDTPIAELGFAGVGVGAAMVGLRPVIEFMTWNFAAAGHRPDRQHRRQDALHVGRPDRRARSCSAGPGGAALQLGAQHSQAFESWYAHIPGLKVVTPATPADAKGLLKSAIRDDDPVVFIEGEMLYNTKGEVPEGEHLVPIGKADVKRAGTRRHAHLPLEDGRRGAQGGRAARRAEGIEAEVVDLRTHPAARRRRRSSPRSRKTHRCVVVEEGWPFAGVGAQVVDVIQREAFDELDAPVLRVTGADVPMPYNKHLERAAKVDPAKVGRRGQAGAVPGRDRMATKVVDGGALPHDGRGAPRRVEEERGRRRSPSGDVLAEVETDKAVMELVARAGGHAAQAGGRRRAPRCRSATLVGVIGAAGRDASARRTAAAPATPASGASAGRRRQPPRRPPPPPAVRRRRSPGAVGRRRRGRVKASPLARSIAAERGIDLGSVQGSGPGGPRGACATWRAPRRSARPRRRDRPRSASAGPSARRAVHRRPAHPDPEDDRQAAGAVASARSPPSTSRPRWTWSGRPRRARRSSRQLGDQGKVSLQRHHPQGGGAGARAAPAPATPGGRTTTSATGTRSTSAWRWRSRTA